MADDKAQHTREYVSILKRPSTQPSGDRWGFEMTSKFYLELLRHLEFRNLSLRLTGLLDMN